MNETVKIGSYEDDDYPVSCILYPEIPARQCRFSRLDFIKEMTKIDKVNWKKGE